MKFSVIEYCQNRNTFLRYFGTDLSIWNKLEEIYYFHDTSNHSYINSSHKKVTLRITTSAVLEIKLLLKNDDMTFGVHWS